MTEPVEAHSAHIITALFHAWQCGRDFALAMKVGDKFRGAIPEAEAAGFKGEYLPRMFVTGYLSHLQKPIMTECDTNVIVSLGPIKPDAVERYLKAPHKHALTKD
jgi:hypothetical protein